jgi:hypothetical protein
VSLRVTAPVLDPTSQTPPANQISFVANSLVAYELKGAEVIDTGNMVAAGGQSRRRGLSGLRFHSPGLELAGAKEFAAIRIAATTTVEPLGAQSQSVPRASQLRFMGSYYVATSRT